MYLNKKLNYFSDSGNKKLYSSGYDAYYCDKCNKWLELQCFDPNCEYCARRPLTPDVQNIRQP